MRKRDQIYKVEFKGRHEQGENLLVMPLFPGMDAIICVYTPDWKKRGVLKREYLSLIGLEDTMRDAAKFFSECFSIPPERDTEPVLVAHPKKRNKIPVLSTDSAGIKKAIYDGYIFCTTRKLKQGASAIFMSDALGRMGEAIGSFYLVPTSIHEMMVIPKIYKLPSGDKIMNLDEIQKMLLDGNKMQPEDDILSDIVYFFDAEKEKLKVAEK